jgi:CRISPR type III-A-associated protein Csm2
MSDEVQPEVAKVEEAPKPAEAEPVKAEPAKQEAAAPQPRPQGDRPPRPERGPKGGPSGAGSRPAQAPGGDRGPRPGGGERSGDRGDRSPRPEGRGGGDRREGGRPNFGGGGGRPFDGPVDIELEKLISDSLYLDNQAHVVVMRMRDMDSGTKSQLRRLYNAVRRAVRAPESERQHQFVMLRARLAYTIARHSLRSLDALERLLLQVTRKNDARGYERFKDLFEAIVAYNE